MVCHHSQDTLRRSREAYDCVGESFNAINHQLVTALTPTLAVDGILHASCQERVTGLNSLPGDSG